MAKKYNTERYVRIFWHIYYKWSILIIQYKINIKFTFTVHECIIVYEQIHIYILLSNLIYIYIYNIYIYTIYYIYVYIWTLCFLFIAALLQLILTMVTLVSYSHDLFQLVLLVETANTIVNMIQVINKEARAT